MYFSNCTGNQKFHFIMFSYLEATIGFATTLGSKRPIQEKLITAFAFASLRQKRKSSKRKFEKGKKMSISFCTCPSRSQLYLILVPVGSDFVYTRSHIHTERFTSRKTTRNQYMLPQVGLKKDKTVPLRQKKANYQKNRTSQPNFQNLTRFFCTAVLNSFVERRHNQKAPKNLNCYQI